MCVYPGMEFKIFARGIKKKAIASKLGITERCLHNKMNGKTSFTWQEVEVLQKDFFPDMSKEEIMEKTAS